MNSLKHPVECSLDVLFDNDDLIIEQFLDEEEIVAACKVNQEKFGKL